MDRKEIEALVRAMRREGVTSFVWERTSNPEEGDSERLEVRFDGGGGAVVAAPAYVSAVAAPVAVPAAPAAASPAAEPAKGPETRPVKSPIVGTFYRAPSPDAVSYVNVGDRVKKGQVVCIVEAMKLMNQIESDLDGVIAEILVENGAPVQFGQELFRVVVA
jgi:acetyl-CoA carboxylase biotin carboxyl carrier protein